MTIIFIILLIVTIIMGLLLVYFSAYSKISTIKIKMDNANDNISKALNKKYDLMNNLYKIIKKVLKKKDYLKEFANLDISKLSSYEIDNELNEYLDTMIAIKEDNKSVNTKEYRSILEDIKEQDQIIIANKKYFNKNNNELIKVLKKQNKLIAKIMHVHVKTSYEIKEPIE